MAQELDFAKQTDLVLMLSLACRLDGERQLREGNAAYSELYRRHASGLLSFLSSRVRRCDLEDVHQVVWERVLTRLMKKEIQGEGKQRNFRGWLFAVAKNYLIDRSRKHTPDLLGESDSHVANESEDDSLLEKERREILERCLQRLEKSGEDAAIIVRGRLAGDSYDEICERTKLSTDRAQRIFHDAKKQLQTCVQSSLS